VRRTYFLVVVVFGMAAATFAQATSPDSQTLKALLTEVRQLRQDFADFSHESGKRPNSAIAVANSGSGRFACVTTLG
jgi:hypothetical protein